MEETIITLVVIALLILVVCPIWTLILTILARKEQRRQGLMIEGLDLAVDDIRRARSAPPSPVQTPAIPQPGPAVSPAPVSVPISAPGPDAAVPHPPPMPKPVAAVTPPPAEAIGEPPPLPLQPPPLSPAPGPLQAKARELLLKAWNWIIIGEEFRSPGVSWEFALATNWLLRLGIVAVVIGVGFFLKYSIEHGLLGPQARVALSVLAGVGMLIAGVRLVGKPYHLLGQGLIGGGLAVLYFSMFAASNLYHLVGPLAAFGLMAMVTLVAGVLAVRLNSLLVAVLGILGGYATPVMLSTGAKNFPGLFGYMLLLGIGILGIARRRRWPLLNYLGLVLTYGLATAAIARQYVAGDLASVLPFLAAFFLLYAVVMFLYNIANREKATVIELLGIMANSLLFFGLGHRVITLAHPEKFAALLALVLAAFYIGLVWFFLARRQHDRGLLFTFLALAALFVALTPPLAISHQWVTASWALQGLVMLWLAGKLESRFLRLLGCAAFLLAAGRLALVDMHRQFDVPLPADATWRVYLKILGERITSIGVPIAALGAAWKMLHRPPDPGSVVVTPVNDLGGERWQPGLSAVLAMIGVGLFFVYAHFELYRTCGFFWPELAVPSMTAAWFAFGLFLLACTQRVPGAWPIVLLAVAMAGMLLKVIVVDMNGWDLGTNRWIYERPYSAGIALIRLGDFGLCLALLAMVFARVRGRLPGRPVGLSAGIAALALLFVYLTLELNTALHHFLPGLRAGAVTLLWAAYALVLLMFGLQRTVRGLRYAGLIIFIVVVFKIFFSDLAHLDALYRIVAFIILGGILLSAALVYLKYRQRFQAGVQGEMQ